MRILLDTNILLRLSDRSDPGHSAARSALDHLETGAGQPLIVPQVLYEYWVVATRPREANGFGLSAAQADEVVGKWSQLYRLLLDERGVFSHWRELVKQYEVKGKPAHDARLVAAMQRHTVPNLLTFNKVDFARFTGVVVYTPQELLTLPIA